MISTQLQGALERAFGYAESEGRANVEVEHLLLSLLEEPSVLDWLKNEPREIQVLRGKLRAHLCKLPSAARVADDQVVPSNDFAGVMQRAILEAQKRHRLEVEPTDVAHLILSSDLSSGGRGHHEV